MEVPQASSEPDRSGSSSRLLDPKIRLFRAESNNPVISPQLSGRVRVTKWSRVFEFNAVGTPIFDRCRFGPIEIEVQAIENFSLPVFDTTNPMATAAAYQWATAFSVLNQNAMATAASKKRGAGRARSL
jgi:hypothetical protein